MASLQFGINLFPHQWQDISRIEELGYDSAWTSEHIFFYFPTFDALTSLAAMAARTSRITLGTAVFLLPLRPAALAAKEIASVDIISGGRLILGVGVGGEYPKEFVPSACPSRSAAPAPTRRSRSKRLFTEDNVTFEGRFTKLDGVTLMPKPPQRGGPPFWVAGRSEAAIRRAGRLGDGYLPYLFSPDRFRTSLAQVREEAEKAGRDPESHQRRHLPVHLPRRHLRRGPRDRRRRPLAPLQPALQERRRPLRRHGQRRRLRPPPGRLRRCRRPPLHPRPHRQVLRRLHASRRGLRPGHHPAPACGPVGAAFRSPARRSPGPRAHLRSSAANTRGRRGCSGYLCSSVAD